MPALAVTAVLLAYWPGVMTWDAVREYGMALAGPIDDWHPPVMIRLWRTLLGVARGPAPMLVLQAALYGAGWAALARRAGQPQTAAMLGACALLPVALVLQGAVLKDSLMAGALLLAAALTGGGRTARIGAAGLLLFAATLRFNAFLAALPLAAAALPGSVRGWRRAGMLAAVAGALLAAMPAANGLIGARPSGVELSQILFDLGGITRFARADAFPPAPGVADPVRVNDGCYDPALWDPYAWWTDSPCPIGWASVGGWFAAHGESPVRWWAAAIARHPLAYARHRLAHFNRNVGLWVGEAAAVVPPVPVPNPYGFEVQGTRLTALVDAAAAWQVRTPFGWPAFWLAVAAGALLLAPALPSRGLAVPLAASALLYGGGYLVLSVASDLRYQLWTMLAALAAAVHAAADMASGARPARWRIAAAVGSVVAVTAVAMAGRLLA